MSDSFSSSDRSPSDGSTGSNGAAASTAVRPDRRRRRHEQKRQRIVDAAWELARRDGLAGISLRDVADLVDLQQPSLYAYFESKLDLYDAMFADGNRRLLEAIGARDPHPDPREELLEFSEQLVRLASGDPERHQLLFQRTIPGFEPSDDSYALAVEFLGTGIERLDALGIDGTDSVDVYTALLSGLSNQQVANDPGGDRWVRVTRPAVEMFLDAVVPVGEDRS